MSKNDSTDLNNSSDDEIVCARLVYHLTEVNKKDQG